jgi:hypothetical protein
MYIWQESWAYRIWVVGGLIGIVAFAVIGGLSDPSNQDFVFTLIPVIAVWVAGIFFLQWRAVQRDAKESAVMRGPVGGLARWNIVFGALLCLAIFAGVYMFYADVGGTLYPFGDTGPGFPVALLPAFALIAYGVLHTLNTVRELAQSGDDPDEGPTDFEGPTDIQHPTPRPRSGGGRSD